MRKLCTVDTIYLEGGGANLKYGAKDFDIPAGFLPEIATEGSVIEIEITIDPSKTTVKGK